MNKRLISLMILAIFTPSCCFAALNLNVQPVHVGSAAPSNQQLIWQLQEEELQLEQQQLLLKKRILELQQASPSTVISSSKDLHWVKATLEAVPSYAVLAFKQNDVSLYVCHTTFLQGVHPGQLTHQGCLITYAGRAFVRQDYQVLTDDNNNTLWKSANALNQYQQRFLMPYYPFGGGSMLPINHDATATALPIQGGQESSGALYICRAIFKNAVHIGKVVDAQCNIGVNGAEVKAATFEVLFEQLAPAQASN